MQLAILALATLPALQQPAPRIETIESLGLELHIPAAITEFESVADAGGGQDKDDRTLAEWRGKLGGKTIWIDVDRTRDTAAGEPSNITWRVHDNVLDEDYEGPNFEFVEHRLIAGPFGLVPYASLLHGTITERGATAASGYVWYLAGIAESSGWFVRVRTERVPTPSESQVVLELLSKGITGSAAKRDPMWSDDVAQKRWDGSVPNPEGKKSLRLEKVIRTAHYIVLTNASGGDNFAKQMEVNYAQIQKTYPFDEIPGRMLMPVFLFQLPTEYHAFFADMFKESLEDARKSKGVAWRDFYATYYEAPKDPVHIHEATHQIFGNRLALDGAGSWFQEGVAEYMSSTKNDRNDIARRVKDGKHTPLREFVQLKSLLFSSENDVSGESQASLHYDQAALLIEFLRESKFGKDKFLTWMHAVGNLPRRDVPKLESATRRVYGVTFDELEREFQEYCRKR